MNAATCDTASATAEALGIALRASNLAERMRIVELAGHAAHRTGSDSNSNSDTGHSGRPPQLDALDAWTAQTLAGKLAAQFGKEAELRDVPVAHSAEQLHSVLTGFRRLELDDTRAAGMAGEITELHSSWLPRYLAALDCADPATAPGRSRWWQQEQVCYGRLAIVCAPFLRLLERELGARPDPVADQLIRDVQAHLLDRFELALAWATEVHAKVHCAQRGIELEHAGRQDYLGFLAEAFRDRGAYHAFFLQFPVLARWLARVTGLLADEARAMWAHLRSDAALVGGRLFGRPIAAFTGFRFGQGDPHAGARSVVRVAVALDGGGAGEFVYKPRCVRAEHGLQRLLGRLRRDGVLDAAPRAVIPRSGHGYEELIPTGRNTVSASAQVEQVYRELGGYLALFYVLGGGDLHVENIMVADGHAHVCDCETVLRVVRHGERRPIGTLLDSVFNTGLLEWPANRTGGDGTPEMKISGYAGGEAYELPIPIPQINERRMSFGMSVTHRTGVRVAPAANNRVLLGEQQELMQPQEFADAILAGFDDVYRWFQDGGQAAADAVAAAFGGARTRFLNWSTQLYAQLLAAVRHPRCLMDPLECDLVFNTLRTLPPKHREDRVLIEHELAALWQWDVPIFTAEVDGERLLSDHRTPVATGLALPPLDLAAERIHSLTAENRSQQAAYVAASLSISAQDESLAVACVDHAARIGERLCRMLHPPGAAAPWTSYRLSGSGAAEAMDIEADLYNGSAGVALFLAHLHDLHPDPAVHAAARRALDHALSAYDRNRIGAFGGVAGIVYLLTHLSVRWQDRGLLDRAVGLAGRLEALIDGDRHFDVLSGSAGAVVVLLGLAARADGAGLEVADRCARHLLRHAEPDGDTLSWPPYNPEEARANLTGLAHGSGGIGWALIALGRALDRPEYVEAGLRGFRYEARHFDDTERDWYDLRRFSVPADHRGHHFANAWCNGAAGVGLTRIAAWDLLGRGDDDILREAQVALTATTRNFPRLRNDTLCHGRSGNAELLLRFAELRDDQAFRLEANVQVQSQWRNFDDIQAGPDEQRSNFFPGLMLGISGFAMHYLRLARPDRVPSVLLLDPPFDP